MLRGLTIGDPIAMFIHGGVAHGAADRTSSLVEDRTGTNAPPGPVPVELPSARDESVAGGESGMTGDMGDIGDIITGRGLLLKTQNYI